MWAGLSRQPHTTTEPRCRRLAVGMKTAVNVASYQYVSSFLLLPRNRILLHFIFFPSSLIVIDRFRSLMMEQPNSLLRKLRALARIQKLQEKLVPTNVQSSV